MQELFVKYGCYKSTVARTDLSKIWHIQSSENHDMMDLPNAYPASPERMTQNSVA